MNEHNNTYRLCEQSVLFRILPYEVHNAGHALYAQLCFIIIVKHQYTWITYIYSYFINCHYYYYDITFVFTIIKGHYTNNGRPIRFQSDSSRLRKT